MEDYDDAIDEIADLRKQLAEAEAARDKLEKRLLPAGNGTDYLDHWKAKAERFRELLRDVYEIRRYIPDSDLLARIEKELK